MSGPLLPVADAPMVRVWEPRRRSILLIAGSLVIALCVCATLQTEPNNVHPASTELVEPAANRQLIALFEKASTIQWIAPNIFLTVVIAMCVMLFGMLWIAPDMVLKDNAALRSLIPVGFERQFGALGMMMAAGMFVAILTGGWRPFCQLNWIALCGPAYAHFAIGDKGTFIVNTIIVLLYIFFGFFYSMITHDDAPGVLALWSQIEWIAPNIFLVILLPIYALTVSILLCCPFVLFKSLMLPQMQDQLERMQNVKEFAIIWGCNLASTGVGTLTAVLTDGWELHCQLHLIGLGLTNLADVMDGNYKKAAMDFFTFTTVYIFFAFFYKILFP